MTIDLPEYWERFVRDEVRSGRFASEAAVVQDALSLLKQRDQEQTVRAAQVSPDTRPIGEIIDEVMSGLPVEVLDRLPVDGAVQHDHYIYGTPKKPS